MFRRDTSAVLLSMVCVLGSACGLAGPAAAVARGANRVRICGRPHLRVLAKSGDALIVGVVVNPQGGFGPYTMVYGCWGHDHRAIALNQLPSSNNGPGGGSYGSLWRANQPMVAFESVSQFGTEGGGPPVVDVQVVDVRTRRVVRDVSVGSIGIDGVTGATPSTYTGKLTALVVTATGAAAWIQDNPPGPAAGGLTGFDVVASDEGGTRVLSAAPSIVTTSLTLSGSIASWLQGTTPTSSALH